MRMLCSRLLHIWRRMFITLQPFTRYCKHSNTACLANETLMFSTER